jgi:hypothetical protein
VSAPRRLVPKTRLLSRSYDNFQDMETSAKADDSVP